MMNFNLRDFLYKQIKKYLEKYIILGLALIFIYLLINNIINYVFWLPYLYKSGLEDEAWTYLIPFNIFMRTGHSLIENIGGQIVITSKIYQFIDFIYFHGSNFMTLIRQTFMWIVFAYIFYKMIFIQIKNTLWRIILFCVANIFIISPINWYAWTNSVHEAWVDLYFFAILSIYFYTKYNQNQHTHRYNFIYMILCAVCAVITSLTFGAGLIIFPILIFLSLLKSRIKMAYVFGIISVVSIIIFLNIGFHSFVSLRAHHINLYYVFIALLIAFSNNLKPYFVSLPIITLSFTIFCYYCMQIFKLKKIQHDPWFKMNSFWIGLFLFSFFNILIIALLRYNSVEFSYHPTSYAIRFKFNTFMLWISLFTFIFAWGQNIAKYHKLRWILYAFTLVLALMLIKMSTRPFPGMVYNTINVKLQNFSIALNAFIPNFDKNLGYFPPYGNIPEKLYIMRLWNIGGFSYWQHNFVGKLLFSDVSNQHNMLQKVKSCKARGIQKIPNTLLTHKIKNTNFLTFSIVQIQGFVTWDHHISTLFVTDSKGIVVGLGDSFFLKNQIKFISIWNIIPLLKNKNWNFKAIVKLSGKEKESYTIWAVSHNKSFICQIGHIIL